MAHRFGGELAAGLQAIAGTVVPLACPGCGLEDVSLCEECAAPWWEEPCRSEAGAPRLDVLGRKPLPVWSLVPLAGPAHGVIRAWKDGRRRDLDGLFEEAMFRAASALSGVLVEVDSVVPIPSHPRSTRTRGVDLTGLLARAAAHGLADSRREVAVARLLLNRGRESRSMATEERWLNAVKGLRVRPGRGKASVVVLVDDVVTTGASIARAASLLEGCGIAVVGALTLSSTPPRVGTSVP